MLPRIFREYVMVVMIPGQSEIRELLAGPMPGFEGWATMAPEHRRKGPLPPPDDAKLAAVLILLYPDDAGNLRIPMMRRPDNTGPHSRQISFPGGAHESHDANLEATALRESEEELNIRPDDVEVLGGLTSLYVPPSGYLVSPYVGWSERRPRFVPDPREVAEILEIPLSIFLDEEHRDYEEMDTRVGRARVPCFRYGADRIWGASAMMLGEFVLLLNTASSPGKHR